MTLTIVETPRNNARYAQACLQDAARRREAPVLAQSLPDAWLECGQQTAVYDDFGADPDMHAGIHHAAIYQRPVVFRKLPADELRAMLHVVTIKIEDLSVKGCKYTCQCTENTRKTFIIHKMVLKHLEEHHDRGDLIEEDAFEALLAQDTVNRCKK